MRSIQLIGFRLRVLFIKSKGRLFAYLSQFLASSQSIWYRYPSRPINITVLSAMAVKPSMPTVNLTPLALDARGYYPLDITLVWSK